MPIPLRNFFESLPLFWKLATVRLTIYIYVVCVNEWLASVEGFNSMADMSALEIEKMHHRIAVAAATTIIAFLDSGMTSIQKNGTLSAEDMRTILSEMSPATTLRQTTTQQTSLTTAPDAVKVESNPK